MDTTINRFNKEILLSMESLFYMLKSEQSNNRMRQLARPNSSSQSGDNEHFMKNITMNTCNKPPCFSFIFKDILFIIFKPSAEGKAKSYDEIDVEDYKKAIFDKHHKFKSKVVMYGHSMGFISAIKCCLMYHATKLKPYLLYGTGGYYSWQLDEEKSLLDRINLLTLTNNKCFNILTSISTDRLEKIVDVKALESNINLTNNLSYLIPTYELDISKLYNCEKGIVDPGEDLSFKLFTIIEEFINSNNAEILDESWKLKMHNLNIYYMIIKYILCGKPKEWDEYCSCQKQKAESQISVNCPTITFDDCFREILDYPVSGGEKSHRKKKSRKRRPTKRRHTKRRRPTKRR